MKLLILLLVTVTAAHHGFTWMELFHPPFLMKVSWPAQRDYYQILHNQKLTIAQQKQQIMVWAKKNKIMKEVTSFFSKLEKRMEKMNQNLVKLVSELPRAVKNLTKIMKNEKQTMPDMMEAVHKFHREHPQVFHVLMAAMMEVMRKHGPHGPHGPHPRPYDGPFPFDGPNGPHPRPHDGPFPFDGPHPWDHHREGPWEKPWHRRWDDGPFVEQGRMATWTAQWFPTFDGSRRNAINQFSHNIKARVTNGTQGSKGHL
uniref:ANIS5_cation-bd domain-containing protein n=1 Tax=Haemonchus contortus TaxID=6289 RepID=A0A7I5EA81_HAECO